MSVILDSMSIQLIPAKHVEEIATFVPMLIHVIYVNQQHIGVVKRMHVNHVLWIIVKDVLKLINVLFD